MTMAFQISSDDVAIVLRANWSAVSNTGGKSFEEMAELQFDDLNFYEIEKAALHGDDIETQTNYAHEEIARQLREKGVLDTPRQADSLDQPANG